MGSNGYANKLKYLFLTDSVVLWVKKDSLNYDPLDQISKDMLRINKADATEKITVKGGLHNTSVTRSRTRKPSGKTYL